MRLSTRLRRLVRVWDYLLAAPTARASARGKLHLEALEVREVPAAVQVAQVIHGQATVEFGSTSAEFALGQSVRFDHALVTGTTRTAADWGTNAAARIALVDTDGNTDTAEAVRVTRGGDGGNASSGALVADLSVVVFGSGATVRHLSAPIAAGSNQADLALGSAAPADRSFVVLTSSANGPDLSRDAEWAVRGELTSPTNLRLRRGGTTATVEVSAQVVTFDADSGASVQSGTVALAGGSTTVGYTPVAGQQPFLVFSNGGTTGGVEGQYRVRGSVSGNQATFATASPSTPWVTYYLVFVPGATVQTGTAGFAAEPSEGSSTADPQPGTHAADAALDSAVDPTRSFALATASGGAGRSDGLGDTSFTATLTGGGSGVRLERADRVDTAAGVSPLEAAATASWSVVQLPITSAHVSVTVPGSQSVDENDALMFSAFYENRIEVAAPSAEAEIEVTVTATNGTVWIDGAEDFALSITLTGTAEAINTALDGLLFAPTESFYGSASLTVTATDHIGPPVAATVPITVRGVTQAPVHTVPDIQHTTIDTDLVFSTVDENELAVVDDFVGTNPVRVTLSVSDGTLSLATTAGLTFTAGDGTDDATMTFSGSVAAINAALDGLTYTPETSFTGTSTLTVTTNDLGNTGSGTPLETTDTVTITVLAVDDAPGDTLSGALVAVPTGPGVEFHEMIGDGANGHLDVDLYAVQLTAGQQLAIRLVGDDDFAAALRVFDGSGAELEFDASGLYFTAAATGTYYIGVSGGSNTGYDPLTAASGTSSRIGSYTLTLAVDVEPPFANADSDSTPQDTPVTLDLLANDTHASGETVSLVNVITGPTVGSVTVNLNGTVTYTPSEGWTGTDTFEYTIRDGRGWTATGTVEIQVSAVDPGPATVGVVASWDGFEGTEYAGATFQFTRVGGDLSQPLTVTITIGGSATEGTDYPTLTREITFEAGEPYAYLTVNAVDDGVVDGGETVVVTVDSDTGYTAEEGFGAATVTIHDLVRATDPGTFVFTIDEAEAAGTFGITSVAIDPELEHQQVALTNLIFTLAGRTFTLSDTTGGATAHFTYGRFDGLSFTVVPGGGGYPYASITANRREVTAVDAATGTPNTVFAFFRQDPGQNPMPADTKVNGKRLNPKQVDSIYSDYDDKLPTQKYLDGLGFVQTPGSAKPSEVFAEQVKVTLRSLALGLDSVNRTYENDKQLFNEAMLRVWTKFFSQQLVGEIRPGFTGGFVLAKFPGSVFWEPTKTVKQVNGKDYDVHGLGLKQGVKPSTAIEEFFTKKARTLNAKGEVANPDGAWLDCASAVVVANRRAWLEIMKPGDFDKAFAGTNILGMFGKNGIGTLQKIQAHGKWYTPGDGLEFTYGDDATLPNENFRNEHAVFLLFTEKETFVSAQPFRRTADGKAALAGGESAVSGAALIQAIEAATQVQGMKLAPIANVPDWTKIPTKFK